MLLAIELDITFADMIFLSKLVKRPFPLGKINGSRLPLLSRECKYLGSQISLDFFIEDHKTPLGGITSADNVFQRAKGKCGAVEFARQGAYNCRSRF
jgi:hypothetical protein